MKESTVRLCSPWHSCFKAFHSNNGRAYLFDKLVNISIGEKVDRLMLTGLHTVADIFCVGCGSSVGWKYEVAYDDSQKYKEGKFILERYQVFGPNGNEYFINQDPQLFSDSEYADE